MTRTILALGLSVAALAACSKPRSAETGAANVTTIETPAADITPAANATDTLSGARFADFKGDPAAGEKAFMACKACHSTESGKNLIGPSLHGVHGHAAGSVAGYIYSAANKGSGITWSNEKMFQYLEKPMRVVPGTKMSFAGIPDPQKRADLIAYLDTLK